MHHRPRPRSTWTVAIVFTMIAALFAAIGSSPAAAQTGPVITNPGPQAHDVGHRACTGLQASAPVDQWSVRGNMPPGVGVDAEFGQPTRARLGGIPTQVGNYSFEVRAESDDLGAGPWLRISYRVFAPDASVPVIKAGKLDQAFTIDCFSQIWVANEFLSDPDNFGPAGRVRLPSGLPIHSQTSVVTAAYLADADILFDGFVGEGSYSASELRRIRQWVENGGVLIAAEDSQLSDRLGDLFGAPTEGFIVPARNTNGGNPWLHCGAPGEIPNSDDIPGQPACPRFSPASGARSHPIVNGPFGSWTSIETDGTVGYMGRRTPAGWTRVADHANGRAAIVERKVDKGHVIIVTDEGTFRTGLTRQNDQYMGNLFAYAIRRANIPDATNDVLTGRAFRRFSADICRNDDFGDGRNIARIIDGSLGPDLRLQGCRIVGTPRSLGNWQATYRLTDADGDIDTAFISVTVNGRFGAADSNPTCRGEAATIVGTPGDDIIRGTRGADVIVAGRGNDVIRGLGAGDIICGDQGRDVLDGGPGRDTCVGGPGRDTNRSCEVRRR
jgi:hypothetical protein